MRQNIPDLTIVLFCYPLQSFTTIFFFSCSQNFPHLQALWCQFLRTEALTCFLIKLHLNKAVIGHLWQLTWVNSWPKLFIIVYLMGIFLTLKVILGQTPFFISRRSISHSLTEFYILSITRRGVIGIFDHNYIIYTSQKHFNHN